jgi:tRNA (adenine57-N1/adenine58-N1)-methyltransferase
LPEDVISEDQDVLVFLDRKRTFLTRVKHAQSLHTHRGFINHDDIIGKEFGDVVKSSLGVDFILLKPTPIDYAKKMLRSTQIIYPKDMGLILVHSGIGCGSRILEAGTGSGALTSILANFVGSEGRVYSYEVRAEFFEKAKKNLERAGVLDKVELKNKDITEGIDESDVDAVVLDLATPWKVVPLARQALKGSGVLMSFSPTIEQVVKTVEALETEGFVNIEAFESIVRRIKVKKGQTRPETLMIGHTGYITKARKTKKPKE